MHFNLFSAICFVIAVIALIAMPVYPQNKKESFFTACVFAVIGAVLLFI